MTIVAVLLLEGIAFVQYRSRIKQFSALDVIFLYIGLSQLVFYFAEYLGFRDFAGADSRSTYLYNNDLGISIYAIIFFITYLSTIGMRIEHLFNFSSHLKATISHRSRGQVVIVLTLYILAVIHLLFLDQDILWENSTYLLLSSPAAMSDNILARSVSSSFQIIAISATFLCVANFFLGRFVLAATIAPLAIWTILFEIANCSRISAILPFISGLLALISLRGSKKLFGSIVCFSFGIFLLVAVLNGRGHSSFGLSAIPSILSGAMDDDPRKFLYATANVFQGIFTTTDSLTINSEHGFEYKILSFSPFPSIIDGFDTIRRSQEIRIAKYVPMSAIAEAILFGPYYTLFLAIVWSFLIRTYLRFLQVGNATLAMMVTGLIVFTFVEANAYPLRNTFRLALLGIAIMLVSKVFFRPRSPRTGYDNQLERPFRRPPVAQYSSVRK